MLFVISGALVLLRAFRDLCSIVISRAFRDPGCLCDLAWFSGSQLVLGISYGFRD